MQGGTKSSTPNLGCPKKILLTMLILLTVHCHFLFCVKIRPTDEGHLIPDSISIRRFRNIVMTGTPKPITSIDFSPNRPCVLITNSSGKAEIFKIEDGGSVCVASLLVDDISNLTGKFTADGARVILGGESSGIIVWHWLENCIERIVKLCGRKESGGLQSKYQVVVTLLPCLAQMVPSSSYRQLACKFYVRLR